MFQLWQLAKALATHFLYDLFELCFRAEGESLQEFDSKRAAWRFYLRSVS